MARGVRIRNLARRLGLSEDDLILWFMEHEPAEGADHPASFVSVEAAARAGAALGPPEAPRVPEERRCRACAPAAAAVGVRLVPVADEADCDRCRGSDNRRAALDLIDAFAARGLSRLLVVGGGPGTAEELRALLGSAIELRIVEGTAHHDSTDAASELEWADVVAIWGGTILPHKVSKLFTDRRGDYRDKIVSVARRGAAALCRAVIDRVTGASRVDRLG